MNIIWIKSNEYFYRWNCSKLWTLDYVFNWLHCIIYYIIVLWALGTVNKIVVGWTLHYSGSITIINSKVYWGKLELCILLYAIYVAIESNTYLIITRYFCNSLAYITLHKLSLFEELIIRVYIRLAFLTSWKISLSIFFPYNFALE